MRSALRKVLAALAAAHETQAMLGAALRLAKHRHPAVVIECAKLVAHMLRSAVKRRAKPASDHSCGMLDALQPSVSAEGAGPTPAVPAAAWFWMQLLELHHAKPAEARAAAAAAWRALAGCPHSGDAWHAALISAAAAQPGVLSQRALRECEQAIAKAKPPSTTPAATGGPSSNIRAAIAQFKAQAAGGAPCKPVPTSPVVTVPLGDVSNRMDTHAASPARTPAPSSKFSSPPRGLHADSILPLPTPAKRVLGHRPITRAAYRQAIEATACPL